MKLVVLTIGFMLAVNTIRAQGIKEPMIINSEVVVDSTGNAVFEISGKLNAQQWQWWNYAYGAGNASNLKRNIERSLSSMYVHDFKYEPNEMERSFKVSYKAKGMVKYLGKDNWIAELGLRETQPIKIADNGFTAVLSQHAGYQVMQTNMRVTLPTDAFDMVFDKDEFNYTVVKYKRPTERTFTVGSSKMKTAGYSLLGASLLSFVGLLLFRKIRQ